MGMLDRETRQVRAKVIPECEARDLAECDSGQYRERVNGLHRSTQRLLTTWPQQDFVHETVNHVEEYVRGQVHTQGIENFWSLAQAVMRGTYVAVEPFHLDRYVTEQVFRYNNRATKDNPLTDADRFTLAVSQISGKRLTYAELTGKVGETTRNLSKLARLDEETEAREADV